MIQETSFWAHEIASKNLGAKQKQVLDALRFFPERDERGDRGASQLASEPNYAKNGRTEKAGDLYLKRGAERAK